MTRPPLSELKSGSKATVADAKRAIERGQAPDGLHVAGRLVWPNGEGPAALPAGLRCYALEMPGAPIEEVADGLEAMLHLRFRDCAKLRRLPRGLKTGALDLAGCSSLESLPEEMDLRFLDVSRCTRLTKWPERGVLRVGGLVARDCSGLCDLPKWMGRVSYVDLAGCANMSRLPDGMEVSSWLDIGGTGVTELPDSLRDVALRWRGVPVDERVCFRPHEIDAREVLAETNAELRRVKMERMGFERFLEEAEPTTLDVDRDAGGERRLLRVLLSGDEPLVCVAVLCPSTGRRYVLRVPPGMSTCRQAIAWTAGFDDPDQYRPLVET